MLSTDTQVNEGLVLPTLNNEFQSISAQGKPLVIYFFAPWCQICHMSISNLQSTFEKNSNIDVIAIAMDFTDKEEVNKFVARHKLTFPIALGKESLKNEFQITGYPSYYVINEQNLITSKSLGYSTELGLYLRSL
ncbi:TlpA family protein disulfide reductase [Thalassotalea sp. M1531]|uniref:TlpA family protein disulfide reductase n=2 Tax=Thalassotalea algicola TaxID=2716224 RepID=A0A7Y0LDY4_9GAMM|nr:TlpA family protein disulfide reductase [Thalassotalea algicola]